MFWTPIFNYIKNCLGFRKIFFVKIFGYEINGKFVFKSKNIFPASDYEKILYKIKKFNILIEELESDTNKTSKHFLKNKPYSMSIVRAVDNKGRPDQSFNYLYIGDDKDFILYHENIIFKERLKYCIIKRKFIYLFK